MQQLPDCTNMNAGDSIWELEAPRCTRLQVSPAPATATFADVPVGDPFHRFVEALVAAGITAGCGGGNYCPNAPITRGQMAVFLAAALGLHWPN
jgi:S-layer homology domain